MRLLVSTDGSPRSLDALAHGERLAAALGASLSLVRVLDPAVDGSKDLALTVRQAAELAAARWREQLAELCRTANVSAEAEVAFKEHGMEVADALLAHAARRRAAAIVMTTRGAGSLRHALFGSVAMGVVGRSPLPVVLVGADAVVPRGTARPYHLLVTTDGSPASSAILDGLRGLLRTADPAAIRLTLLRVHSPSVGGPPQDVAIAACERELQSFRRKAPRRFALETVVRPIVTLGGVDSAILEAAKECGADAIAMATHGHSAKYHLLSGSIANGVLAHSTVPVIMSRSRA